MPVQQTVGKKEIRSEEVGAARKLPARSISVSVLPVKRGESNNQSDALKLRFTIVPLFHIHKTKIGFLLCVVKISVIKLKMLGVLQLFCELLAQCLNHVATI